MKSTCNHEKIIAYLYDELDQFEKNHCELHFQECEQCRWEVESFRILRAELKPSEAPPMPHAIHIPRPSIQPASSTPLLQTTWFRAMASSAAAILVLILTAWFTELRLEVGEGKLTIGFGPAIEASTESTFSDLRPDLEVLMAQFRNEQSNLVNSLSDSIRQSQQEQFDQTLAAFQRYLEQRRVEDLNLIALSLDEMQQINDYRFVETQYVLSQLVNQMNQEILTVNRR
jgi:hypothetical protein